MKTRDNRYIRIWVLLVLVLGGLAGCGTSKPTSFYLLSPISDSAGDLIIPKSEQCLTLGIGPIDLPDYLDRPQIVTQGGANELHVSEFDQWAEPLGKTFSRVLEENLSKLLCVQLAVFLPQKGSNQFDYQVQVNVIRFLGQPDGSAILVAQWSVLDRDDKLVAWKRSTFHQPERGQGYAALAAAESQTVADLSREIAEAILKAAK